METIESFKSIYQAYLESNLTVRDFCKKLEIPEGRFYYWQKRIRDEDARANGEFMPVSINNHAGKVVLVGNGRQRPVALSRKNYLFCKNHDAAEDAAVMYTMMGCCKIAGVNVEEWLTYYLDHVHEYDNDYSRDLAELLPYALEAKGILKK